MGLRTRTGTPDVEAFPFTELLERRQLFAVIEAGVLVARGTALNDTISARRSLTDDVIVTTNGISQTFDMDDFTGVRLEALEGDDTFNLIDPLVSPVVRNTTIVGGAGSDTLSYATRVIGLSFKIDPNGSQVTSGAQVDEFSEIELARGGNGNDTFEYGNSTAIAPGDENLGFGISLSGDGGDDRFIDSLDIDHNFGRVDIFAGTGDDTFEDDEQGNDFFFGSDGNDRVVLDNTAYPAGKLFGEAGSDTITFAQSVTGSVFNLGDFGGLENGISPNGGTLVGNELNNYLQLDSPGTIQGGDGNDTLVGSSEADLLLGQLGNDWLAGREGNDTLDGGDGVDTIDGDGGSNTNLNGESVAGQIPAILIIDRVLNVMGGSSGDTITIGRVGNDDVLARVGALSAQFDIDDFDSVLIQGFGGNDSITMNTAIVTAKTIRKATIDGGGGNDTITGSSGEEVLRGNVGSDILSGLGGRDALFGGDGNDSLFGGRGLDFFDGGNGNDFLDASDGLPGETVLGGSGTDSAKLDKGDGATGVEMLA
jgi:Ca2+-binding RTX toxin-like protein